MTNATQRTADLRLILMNRRHELQEDVRHRIRDDRATRAAEVQDDVEHSDAEIQRDIELALLQMRADTLTRIDAALVRLDAGKYGACFECDGEISEPRLRALPFAVRCQACEVAREQTQHRVRQLAERRSSFSLFSEVIGS